MIELGVPASAAPGVLPAPLAAVLRPVLSAAYGVLYRRRHRRFRRYCARIPERRPSPLYVSVGANDGTSGDPLSDLIVRDSRWRALLIEPVPACFERLRARFGRESRLGLERVAIGRPTGRALFHAVDPEARRVRPDLPAWCDQLGSFSREHITRHLGESIAPFVRSIEVEVRGLSELLNLRNLGAPDLLQIDTEGHEAEVLDTLDFDRHAPVALFVEHKHLRPEVRRGLFEQLRRRGYRIRLCGHDFMAVRCRAGQGSNG